MAEEHDHTHEYADIVESETIFVYAETLHKVITIQFPQRGMALSFSYDEAVELADAMEIVKAHITEAH